MRRENGDGIGGSGSPIVSDENKATQGKGVGEIEDVLGERGSLPTERVWVVDASGTETPQVWHQDPQSVAVQVVDHAIPRAKAVRKSVEQNEREFVGRTVIFVFDVDETGAGKGH